MSGLAALLINQLTISLEDLTLLLASFSSDKNKKWFKDLNLHNDSYEDDDFNC